jgi:DNA-binding MarR family transcriptional regulator
MARERARDDAVDGMIDALADVLPDVDARAHGAVARLRRTHGLVYSELEAVAADFGTSIAALEALAALRLAATAQPLSQRAFGELLLRTSGTLSVRLHRLEREGLIARAPDPQDARGVLVELTPRGRELVDAAIAARAHAEAKLLAALSTTEQDRLSDLLRKLLASLERRATGPRLGITIAARRAAKDIRAEHGIADGVGLLVTDVEEDSAAARAGIRGGDLLLRLGGRQLRSGAQLKRALFELDNGGVLEITLLRGGDELAMTVPLLAPTVTSG